MPSDSIELAILRYINTKTAITNLIGLQSLFYIDAPQGTKVPYIVFRNIAPNNSARTLCLKKAGDHTFEFNIYEKDKYKCLIISRALIDVLRFVNLKYDGVTIDITRPSGVILNRDDITDDLYVGTVQCQIQYIEP